MHFLVLAPNTPGLASEDLISYLLNSEHYVDVMTHPVAPTSKRETKFLDEEITIINRGRRIVPLTYRKDVSLTQKLVRQHKTRSPYLGPYDWVICLSPPLGLAGLRLRKSGLVKKTAYWALDYYPTRYGRGGTVGSKGLRSWAGLVVEKMYRHLEATVVRESDIRWVVQDKMLSGWKEGGYRWKGYSAVVPHAISRVRKPIPFADRTFRTGLVWTGMLRPEFGFDLVLEAWPQLVELFPDLVLHVTSRSGIPDYYKDILGKKPFESIKYLGFLETREEMEDLVAHSGVALALYLPGSYKRYSDSARIKSAAACGIPTITTDYIGNVSDISQFSAGLIIPPTKSDLVSSIHSLLINASLNDSYSNGAHDLAQNYETTKVFNRALESLV